MKSAIKKTVSAALAVLTLLMTFSVCAQAARYKRFTDNTFTLGDADGNGKLNGIDSYLAQCYVVGKEGMSELVNTQAVDLAANGTVNGTDLYYLKCLLVGKLTAADLENGRQLYRMTVAGNDISTYEIVVCGGTANDNVYCAAELFNQYLYETAGIRLNIVFDSSDSDRVIRFNRLDPLCDEALELGLGNEGYIIDVENGNINITGTLRGTMYASYELIEKYMGVRFFDNDYVFLYKIRNSDIPEGTHIRKDVKLELRYCGGMLMCQSALWGSYYGNRLNGSQIYAGGNSYDGYQTGPHFINAHSFDYYWKMGTGIMPDESYGTLSERYAAKYESGEYKNQFTWQPCASSEQQYEILYTGMIDVIEMITAWGSHHFLPQYGGDSMSFSINDNSNYCSCRYCNKFANGVLDKNTGEWISPPEGHGGLYMNLANRAARDVQEYMPGLKIYLILYDHTVPATVRPDKNLILMYCGHGCNNHILGSGDCGDNKTMLGGSNAKDEIALKEWADIAHAQGASLWFWSYGVNYHYYLGGGCPNIPEMYYEMKYIIEECGVDGFYFEGCDYSNNFEKLKSYISAKLMWEPDMTYDEFVAYIKEYLYMYYGDGYEQLWQYILMQTEAGDRRPCFINNYDRPGDQMDYAYLAEHYEEMHGLLQTAYELAGTDWQRTHVKYLMLSCEFMGLSSVYDDWYVNGDADSRALYTERYTWFYNFVKESGVVIASNGSYKVPATLDLSVNPMIQFYEFGSNRPGVTP